MTVPSAELADFRAHYRTRIEPGYDPRVHLVFLYAVGCGGLASHVPGVLRGSVGSSAFGALGLLTFQVGIYLIHRYLGHQPTRIGGLFYKRHQLDHHGFFHEDAMAYDELRDLRVVLFPKRLLVALVAFSHVAAWVLGGPEGSAYGFGIALGYLLYETVHLVDHLPDDAGLTRWPGFRAMRRLHARHHRPGRPLRNFDIVVPLTDPLFGTFAPADPPPM